MRVLESRPDVEIRAQLATLVVGVQVAMLPELERDISLDRDLISPNVGAMRAELLREDVVCPMGRVLMGSILFHYANSLRPVSVSESVSERHFDETTYRIHTGFKFN